MLDEQLIRIDQKRLISLTVRSDEQVRWDFLLEILSVLTDLSKLTDFKVYVKFRSVMSVLTDLTDDRFRS